MPSVHVGYSLRRLFHLSSSSGQSYFHERFIHLTWNSFLTNRSCRSCLNGKCIGGVFLRFTQQNESKQSCGHNQYVCANRECISDLRVCDGHLDCRSGDDESNCGCNGTYMMSEFYFHLCQKLPKHAQKQCPPFAFVCPNEKCISASLVCDGNVECKDKSDEFCNYTIEKSIPDLFLCVSGQTIQSKYVNDLIPDCIGGDDELNYITAAKNRTLRDQKCDTYKYVEISHATISTSVQAIIV